MSAPFRITRPDKSRRGIQQPKRTSSQDFKYYLDRLLKMIPAEIIGLYLVGSGLIPAEQTIGLLAWSIVCLIAVVVVRAFGTADPAQGKSTIWVQVGISTIAFIIWLYSIGGPFRAYGLYVPWIGSLAVLAWSFFVPYFYKGAAD